jgi:hypothetical protein
MAWRLRGHFVHVVMVIIIDIIQFIAVINSATAKDALTLAGWGFCTRKRSKSNGESA